MHYVISDIHNDNLRLKKMLNKITFSSEDHLFVLGDLFDRGGADADPIGVYYTLLGLEDRCTFVRGNHDTWLADYILEYYSLKPREQSRFIKYEYNTFEIMNNRITQVDMIKLAEAILSWPLQYEFNVENHKYLFAHSMAAKPGENYIDDYYLMGTQLGFPYLKNGIDGYVSVNGHHHTSTIRQWYGDEYRPKHNEIWVNPQKNVYMIDCGCGFSTGRLACLRLEDKKEFYV